MAEPVRVGVVRYAGAGVASLIGVGILVAGLTGGGRGGDLVWYVLVFAACQFFAARALRRARAAESVESMDAMLAERAERLAAKRAATGPVLGKKCEHCARRIVVEDEGGRCEECAAPVHWGCMKEHAAAHRASKDAYR